ncbi:MAG TPA: hypothetical protein VH370_00225 [Humisphaera sp.]|jgi:hypothetical protein|nr:hypothetical protein [Humisphaera sp.]
MIDSETKEKVVVRTEGGAGAYIMVPLDQIAEIEGILRDNRVSFWVDSDAISLDGKPAISVINLGRGADVARVQRLLDAAN